MIDDKLKELELLYDKLDDTYGNKAFAISSLDRKIAFTLAALRNGKQFTIDGETIKDPPVSSMDKLARGICYGDVYAMEMAEGEVKALNTKINACIVEINAMQSKMRIEGRI